MSHRLRPLLTGLVGLALLGASTTPAAAATTDVAIVGDSIGDRARTQIRNLVEPGHDIVFYETQDSATIRRMGPMLLERVRRPGGPDIVVVELGVGNAFWGTSPADFRKQARYLTQQLLEEVTCLRWLEQKPGGNRAYPRINVNAARFNQILRTEVNSFARARTVHYEAWTRLAGDSVFVPDLLHLNPRGKRGLARLVRQAVEGCDPAVTSGRFWDVPDRHWASTEIDWVGDQHLIDGYANGTYRAEVGGIVPALDRLGWIRALWRRAGRPDGYPAAPWPDANAQNGAPLAWASAEEVTSLDPEAAFRPGAPITRADAVQWLYRAEGRPDATAYPDARPDRRAAGPEPGGALGQGRRRGPGRGGWAVRAQASAVPGRGRGLPVPPRPRPAAPACTAGAHRAAVDDGAADHDRAPDDGGAHDRPTGVIRRPVALPVPESDPSHD